MRTIEGPMGALVASGDRLAPTEPTGETIGPYVVAHSQGTLCAGGTRYRTTKATAETQHRPSTP